MKVLSFPARSTLQRRIAKALRVPPFVVETAVSTKECLQFAQVARYEAVLVYVIALKLGDVLTALVQIAEFGRVPWSLGELRTSDEQAEQH